MPERGGRRRLPARLHTSAGSTPTRLRLLALLVAGTVLTWTGLLAVDVSAQRTGLRTIGQRDAPLVEASSDLYTALNDMDAQLANVLLVGRTTDLGFTRQQAVGIYEQRRVQADHDLQSVAAAAQDAATGRSVRELLDGLGQYESRAAQTLLLDQQANHSAGRTSPAALADYRQASDLLRSELLPAARSLIQTNASSLDRTYTAQRTLIRTDQTRLLLVGCLIVILLVALQMYLAHRFHRVLALNLALASVLAVGVVVDVVSLHAQEAEHLRVAKTDAFDSVLALSQARAVGYDMNADESRYLVDRGRSMQYQQTFLVKSQELVELPQATLATYDQQLGAALVRQAASPAEIGWGGFLGTEFRNITFTGERSAAETTIRRYQTYQSDDRKIRSLVAAGERPRAIAFCTSYRPDDSNYAFTQYDTSLSQLITINQQAFTQAISDGERELRWTPLLGAAVGLALCVLLLAGIRARVAEYNE